MFRIHLKGDISEIEKGLGELLLQLDAALDENGDEVVVRHVKGSDLKVSFDTNKGEIIYSEKCHFFRGFGLLIENLSDKKTSFRMTEKPQFKLVGPMFDVSQGNSCFNVRTLKSVIRQIALMGLSMLMIYCEDSFEVKKQPYFGYMRAKYSEEDMRELDDYSDLFGIEMIPCCQTLAHMPDTLRWKVFDNIRDYDACLLVGKEETYRFIEDLIVAASRPFRSRKINICMDEAWKLGRGQYLDTFGYEEPASIMRKHLKRVKEILDRHNLEPMMFSDMFFRSYGTGKRFQPNIDFPQEIKDGVPKGMKLLCWDYYRLKEEDYDGMLRSNLNLTNNIGFVGGVWTWHGYALNWTKTVRTTEEAMRACKKHGIDTILMSTWGDNGTECLMNATLIGCQLFAEHAYSDRMDYEKMKKRFRFITGGNVTDFEKLEKMDVTPLTEHLDDPSPYNCSKYLMWQDILTGLCDKNIEGFALDEHYRKLAAELKECAARNGQFNKMFDFEYHAADVLSLKSQMGLRVTEAYRKGDREALRRFAEIGLPLLRKKVIALRKSNMENWFEIYKPLGWDVLDMRYGSLIARIDSAIYEIREYLDGRFERLEELEQERLYWNGVEGPIYAANAYGTIVSPSRIAPDA